jgi:hypothetical protein
VTGLGALGDLLDKDGTLVPVVFSDLGLGRRLVALAIATLITTVAAAVSGPITELVITSVTARGAGARTATSAVVVAATVPATTASAVAVVA